MKLNLCCIGLAFLACGCTVHYIGYDGYDLYGRPIHNSLPVVIPDIYVQRGAYDLPDQDHYFNNGAYPKYPYIVLEVVDYCGHTMPDSATYRSKVLYPHAVKARDVLFAGENIEFLQITNLKMRIALTYYDTLKQQYIDTVRNFDYKPDFAH